MAGPRVGQIKMQAIGFLGMALGMGILVAAVGGTSGASQSTLLVLVGFCVFNLLMNMGPNSTTFGMPALLFPSEIRATAAGFSAACAKIGATLGTLFLPKISRAIGLQYTLVLLACLAGVGFLITTTTSGYLGVRARGLEAAARDRDPVSIPGPARLTWPRSSLHAGPSLRRSQRGDSLEHVPRTSRVPSRRGEG